MPNKPTPKEDQKSLFVIAYIAMALSGGLAGFIAGIITGWLMWS